MKKYLLFLAFLFSMAFSYGQDSLGIFECYSAIEKNYPKSGEKALNEKQGKLNLQNINTEWYPQMDLNIQATYQSDVVQVNLGEQFPFPVDIPSASQDQYKATLDISQMIYDGGMISASKSLEQLNTSIRNQSVEVDIYQVKDRVTKVYYSILLLEKQKQILHTTLEELQARKKKVRSAVDNGALLPSDLQTMEAELLRFMQNLDDVKRNIQAGKQVLEVFTGLKIPYGARLILPEILYEDIVEIQRPENELFDIQKRQLDANKSLVQSQNMPKLFAFGQLGYGKPGLNMLQDEFDSFYIVGAKLTWKVWDWNKNNRKRQELEVRKEIIDTREAAYKKNIEASLSQLEADIENLEQFLTRDKQIVDLRTHVINSAKSKLENGVITSAEYISDLNQLKTAKLTHEKHRIELSKAKLQYMLTAGHLSSAKAQNQDSDPQ